MVAAVHAEAAAALDELRAARRILDDITGTLLPKARALEEKIAAFYQQAQPGTQLADVLRAREKRLTLEQARIDALLSFHLARDPSRCRHGALTMPSQHSFHETSVLSFLLSAAFSTREETGDPKRAANTVVLTESGVKNLRIETVEVEETDFEETIFALGRIEAIPLKRSGVSSRIPGRIVELKVALGDIVEAGAEVARLESRQAGGPASDDQLAGAWRRIGDEGGRGPGRAIGT